MMVVVVMMNMMMIMMTLVLEVKLYIDTMPFPALYADSITELRELGYTPQLGKSFPLTLRSIDRYRQRRRHSFLVGFSLRSRVVASCRPTIEAAEQSAVKAGESRQMVSIGFSSFFF